MWVSIWTKTEIQSNHLIFSYFSPVNDAPVKTKEELDDELDDYMLYTDTFTDAKQNYAIYTWPIDIQILQINIEITAMGHVPMCHALNVELNWTGRVRRLATNSNN